ncbi:SprT-like family-domain-containing protein [Triangularia verruculosa]|uniref:SprT-like family-domain-containing protein n=1 Tax=Triangularia verruculosa TaxID=2587418 RepID=A0AAN7AXT9_9PEZI|nr:SprT-like family-domain-containing protein [Triangularia verruculosa]
MEIKSEKAAPPARQPATVRRRKLAPTGGVSSSLLRAWTPEDSVERELKPKKKVQKPVVEEEEEEDEKPRRTRVELRTKKTKVSALRESLESKPEDEQEYVSAREEVSIIEDVSMFDDTFHSCESEEEQQEEDHDDDDDDDEGSYTERGSAGSDDTDDEFDPATELQEKPTGKPLRGSATRGDSSDSKKAKAKNLEDRFSRLRLNNIKLPPPRSSSQTTMSQKPPSSPPGTPPRSPPRQRGLVSPTKLPRIPNTPHRPSTDMFWSQEFVEDWNDQHSPAKQLFPSSKPPAPPPTTTKSKSKSKSKPKPKSTPPLASDPPSSSPAKKPPSEKQALKDFEATRTNLASTFLALLDEKITNSQLTALSAPTGGIKILWSKTLATTAGRANWKRETLRPTPTNPTPAVRHHCSIELSTKVITTPHRLYNVLAHEFCHLCNFMISGITTNPHGKEFKAWGARVTREFGGVGGYGVEVTTRHSYEIDFKYVWACEECGMEYKRHSKSIDTGRHRCGGCKGLLRQVKPTPRGGGNGGEGTVGGENKRQSAYQVFMKEEMRRVKGEEPGMQQRDVMRVVAERWKREKERLGGGSADSTPLDVETKRELPVRKKKEVEVVDLT